MSFLSDGAVGYYAPALMLIALEHGTDANTLLSDAIDILWTEFLNDTRPLARRCGHYTLRQKAAVAAFLSAVVDVEYAGAPASKLAIILDVRFM